MQIVVHDIEAEHAGLDLTEQRVHVRAVHVHQAAAVVNGLNDFEDAGVEDAECAGDGDHHASDGVVAGGAQRFEVDIAVVVGGQFDDVQASHRDGGGICPVRAVGNENVDALVVAAIQMILADHEDAGEFALRASGGGEAGSGESGDFGEPLLKRVHDGERALRSVLVGEGMERAETGQTGDILIDLGVVLHGAGAERVETAVDAVVEAAEVGEMAHDL